MATVDGAAEGYQGLALVVRPLNLLEHWCSAADAGVCGAFAAKEEDKEHEEGGEISSAAASAVSRWQWRQYCWGYP